MRKAKKIQFSKKHFAVTTSCIDISDDAAPMMTVPLRFTSQRCITLLYHKTGIHLKVACAATL